MLLLPQKLHKKQNHALYRKYEEKLLRKKRLIFNNPITVAPKKLSVFIRFI